MFRWIPIAAVLFLVAPQAFAQTTSRLQREVDRSQPRLYPEDEARRQAQNEAARDPASAVGQNSNRLLRMPGGHYVIAPDKYRPDWWSPRIRRFPDYSRQSPGRFSRSFQNSRKCRTFGGHGCAPARGFGGYAPYAYDPYGYGGVYDSFGDAYEQGRFDADNEYMDYIAAQRAGQALDASRYQLQEGMTHFRAGRYDRAAIAWLNAAEVNHGDAASRVYAGHALFAVGRYDEAVRLIARGFELAPQLAGHAYDLRDDYTVPEDFEDHYLRLKNYVAARPDDASAVTLLGYVQYYTLGPAAAYPALARASRLCPGNYFIPKLLNNARMLGVPSDATLAPEERRLDRQIDPDLRPTIRKEPPLRQAPSPASPQLKIVRSDEHR